MILPPEPSPSGITSFRTRLLVAMMLVISAVTVAGLLFAQHDVSKNVLRDLQGQFQAELASLHAVQDLRDAALAERCRALAHRPHITAAIEEAQDQLYSVARDELQDIMGASDDAPRDSGAYALHARFYRFLDSRGAVIAPPNAAEVGELSREEEAALALPHVPVKPETGYVLRSSGSGAESVDEVLAMPIFSTETGDPIAAIVLGFKPVEMGGRSANSPEIKSGLWQSGRLYLPSVDAAGAAVLTAALNRTITTSGAAENSFNVELGGVPHLLFYKRLNPDSLFPPTYEVSIYPLTESLQRQRQLVWEFTGAGALLLLGGLAASRFVSIRLAKPVEKLAVTSEENLTQRKRAEAALELTHEELQRSARFSADASHQLKTPVTVLRAGLEELLAGEKLGADVREEVATLVHQTFRLTSVIEDLLLLSRMDAGRLRLEFSPVNLTPLIEGWLDDLGALPDPLNLSVETDFPPALYIAGEKRYTSLILQNLLENARKYNRAQGRIRIVARAEGEWVRLAIANTGRPIPPAAQAHIFERFHRGAIGENVPGYGLGLNLARELARIHHGDLRLARSDDDWTEFEVYFRPAAQPSELKRQPV